MGCGVSIPGLSKPEDSGNAPKPVTMLNWENDSWVTRPADQASSRDSQASLMSQRSLRTGDTQFSSAKRSQGFARSAHMLCETTCMEGINTICRSLCRGCSRFWTCEEMYMWFGCTVFWICVAYFLFFKALNFPPDKTIFLFLPFAMVSLTGPCMPKPTAFRLLAFSGSLFSLSYTYMEAYPRPCRQHWETMMRHDGLWYDVSGDPDQVIHNQCPSKNLKFCKSQCLECCMYCDDPGASSTSTPQCSALKNSSLSLANASSSLATPLTENLPSGDQCAAVKTCPEANPTWQGGCMFLWAMHIQYDLAFPVHKVSDAEKNIWFKGVRGWHLRNTYYTNHTDATTALNWYERAGKHSRRGGGSQPQQVSQYGSGRRLQFGASAGGAGGEDSLVPPVDIKKLIPPKIKVTPHERKHRLEVRAYCGLHRQDMVMPRVYPMRVFGLHRREASWTVPCQYWTCIMMEPVDSFLPFVSSVGSMLSIMFIHYRLLGSVGCGDFRPFKVFLGAGKLRRWWLWLWAGMLPLWIVMAYEVAHSVTEHEQTALAAGFEAFAGWASHPFNLLILAAFFAGLAAAWHYREKIKEELGIQNWDIYQLIMSSFDQGLHEDTTLYQICVWRVDSRHTSRALESFKAWDDMRGSHPIKANAQDMRDSEGQYPSEISISFIIGHEVLRKSDRKSVPFGMGGFCGTEAVEFNEAFRLRVGSQAVDLEVNEVSNGNKSAGSLHLDVEELDTLAQQAYNLTMGDNSLDVTQYKALRQANFDPRQRAVEMAEVGFKPFYLSQGGFIWIAVCNLSDLSPQERDGGDCCCR
eukprot:TRINITY_DN61419_c0_g1_i1.p1 TRINITY_DN61419_c0_g1~~TRINITY_DN61419_c0_g1_i1.p1  ORF type:complete len:806 (+),score=108.01 TRINITY_DN61419_c0_g1_i1:102-2519(+)